MNLEVLITTMYQTDFRKYKEMNLQTDAVLANQADFYGYQEEKIDQSTVRMISTATRGLSRNRNIAIAMSTGEYILFADDDLQFVDGYADIIENEFAEHPEAEAIKFNLFDLSENRKISMKSIEKFERATMLNMGASGVCGIAIKKNALIKANLKFNEKFGTGTENYCGEDTIFIFEMLKKKIKLYRSPKKIAGIDQTESSWFEGYNEKYFQTVGKVLGTMYPFLSYLIVIRSAYKFTKRDKCHLKFLDILKNYYKGIKSR